MAAHSPNRHIRIEKKVDPSREEASSESLVYSVLNKVLCFFSFIPFDTQCVYLYQFVSCFDHLSQPYICMCFQGFTKWAFGGRSTGSILVRILLFVSYVSRIEGKA